MISLASSSFEAGRRVGLGLADALFALLAVALLLHARRTGRRWYALAGLAVLAALAIGGAGLSGR